VSLRWLLLLVCSWTFAEARDLDAARRHYKKAAEAFAHGGYHEAADEYILSYQASDDPVLLYNIGVALRLDHQRPQAVRAFRMYLKRVPDADNRAECESAIRELLQPEPSPSP